MVASGKHHIIMSTIIKSFGLLITPLFTLVLVCLCVRACVRAWILCMYVYVRVYVMLNNYSTSLNQLSHIIHRNGSLTIV